MVSRGGSNGASYNTTNLIRHLKKHKAEYKEYSAATESKAGLKQQTLLASLRKDKFPRGGEKARMITQRLTEFIALDGPFPWWRTPAFVGFWDSWSHATSYRLGTS